MSVKRTLKTLSRLNLTDHRQLVLGGRQHVLENEQQDGDGEQDGHFEAHLLSAALTDEEWGQIQDQQVEQGHDENDQIKQRLPDDFNLKNLIN